MYQPNTYILLGHFAEDNYSNPISLSLSLCLFLITVRHGHLPWLSFTVNVLLNHKIALPTP